MLRLVIFIETRIFTEGVLDLLSDNEYSDVQQHLVSHPESGDLIKDTGGLRKVR
jgi:hypothetical protein